MKNYKRLKDPIYGYINVPAEYMLKIIDTAPFQRLRRIIQTSYTPLYSSALHNRFVHSIGVYHLGVIACKQIKHEIELRKDINIKVDRLGEIFCLACLLHDVGHAPFSHTGEKFYLDSKTGYKNIHNKLVDEVGNEEFRNDIPTSRSKSAAPHEVMSSIIGLKEFSEFFNDESEKEFFARCITGYKYSHITIETGIKNCFITLLNSTVIDVDKLDYLIRDSYSTGFDTTRIDYERLLSALTITKENNEIGYYKNAISVIENVIYAHDSERKWIQTHPVVLYESYIIQNAISNLSENFEDGDKKLFSLETLGREGLIFNNNIKLSLLSDDDITYLMKNVYPNELSNEFFERKNRRHPVWKSEAEYNTFFLGKLGSGEILEKLESAIEATVKYLTTNNSLWVINDEVIDKIKSDLADINTAFEQGKIKESDKLAQEKDKKKILKVMNCLHEYAVSKNLKCNFVIITAAKFYSGFGKPDFSKIKIVLKSSRQHKVKLIDEIVSSLKAKEVNRDDFFYLYYKRDDDGYIKMDTDEIANALVKEFVGCD